MNLFSLQNKQRIKRLARRMGLLNLVNRVEYAYGNRITASSRQFYRHFVTPGSLCFDIGAHHGAKTRLFRQLGATVVAVEPLPDCFAVLEENFAMDQNVILWQGACGESQQVATIRRSPLNPQNSTLSSDFAESLGSDVEWEAISQIKVMTLDKLIAEYGVPSFCKIDTEGYEFVVLAGLSQPIRALSFEFHVNDLLTVEKCLTRLRILGYEKFNYTLDPREKFVAGNWISAEELPRELARCHPEAAGNVFAKLGPTTALRSNPAGKAAVAVLPKI